NNPCRSRSVKSRRIVASETFSCLASLSTATSPLRKSSCSICSERRVVVEFSLPMHSPEDFVRTVRKTDRRGFSARAVGGWGRHRARASGWLISHPLAYVRITIRRHARQQAVGLSVSRLLTRAAPYDLEFDSRAELHRARVEHAGGAAKVPGR